MNEHHVDDMLLDYLRGDIDQASSRTVKEHLNACEACRQEYESLQDVWRRLGQSQDEMPAASLSQGFYEMVRGYELGMRQTAAQRSPRTGRAFLDRLLAGRPAFQIAFTVALLLIGLVGGLAWKGSSNGSSELAQLREEVHGLHNLLTVSLLQQPSASERLKGVSWSSRVDGSDPEISDALLKTMKYDPNINVRLAALNALAKDIDRPAVRQEILQSFPEQSSPLMQIAMVDLLVQINDRESRAALQEALNRKDLNPEVRKRIQHAIQVVS